jgi:23S rRNA (guanosine2251-2'-O)-methyltransferase
MTQPEKHKDQHWVCGIQSVLGTLKSTPGTVQRLLVSGKNKRLERVINLAHSHNILIEQAARSELDKITGNNHQGVAALCDSPGLHDEQWLYQHISDTSSPPLLLLLDEVTDPHNLGACLRTADATGVNAIVIPRDNSCGITPVVSKVASGAAETVPVVAVANLARCMKKLQELGLWIFGTCDQSSQTLFDTDLRSPMALVLGAEGKGIRRLTREHCDVVMRIPMAGSVESLNVSVAAGVCLFEVVRQRSGQPG